MHKYPSTDYVLYNVYTNCTMSRANTRYGGTPIALPEAVVRVVELLYLYEGDHGVPTNLRTTLCCVASQLLTHACFFLSVPSQLFL